MMRRRVSRLAVAAAALLAVGLAGCGGSGGGASPAGTKMQVAASIFPLAEAAKAVGGDQVEVATILPPGEEPHGFQPKPRDAEALARARLLLTVGLGLDLWADRAGRASGNKDLRTLEMYAVVKVTPIRVTTSGPADPGEAAEHAMGDPHLWIDPVIMKTYVAALADKLGQLDPAHAADFQMRAAAYDAALDQLDADYRRTLATARIKSFVAFHSAFTYVANRYGLSQEAVYSAERGELGPKHFEDVVRFIRERGIKVIFMEPGSPAGRVETLARQTGTKVMVLDPMGSPTKPSETYLSIMRANLAVLAQALECTNGPPVTRPAP